MIGALGVTDSQIVEPTAGGLGESLIFTSSADRRVFLFAETLAGSGNYTFEVTLNSTAARCNFHAVSFIETGGGGSAPSISDAGDETYTNGETGIVIDGADFGASQGAGTVKICPTDDVNDANAVTQTITAWGDSQVTFTAVRSTLAVNTTCYLFVVNDDGLSNVAGYPVQIASDAPRPISLRPYLPLLVR
jgi:hypothetical protein